MQVPMSVSKLRTLTNISQWISVTLTPLLGLDASTKNKSGLYVADLDLMLHHHWVLDEEVFSHERFRVQLAAILVLAGATSTRPGGLVENLHYKDVEFQVFPSAAGGGRARLGMVVKLTKIRGDLVASQGRRSTDSTKRTRYYMIPCCTWKASPLPIRRS
jgi:hypothetical protein